MWRWQLRNCREECRAGGWRRGVLVFAHVRERLGAGPIPPGRLRHLELHAVVGGAAVWLVGGPVFVARRARRILPHPRRFIGHITVPNPEASNIIIRILRLGREPVVLGGAVDAGQVRSRIEALAHRLRGAVF